MKTLECDLNALIKFGASQIFAHVFIHWGIHPKETRSSSYLCSWHESDPHVKKDRSSTK
jgi:hypothetical protein